MLLQSFGEEAPAFSAQEERLSSLFRGFSRPRAVQ
jgi:hypothetical protein